MDQAQIKTTAVLVTVTLVFGLLASHAKAGERKPSRADYQNLEDIKDNQKIISKCREDHNTLKNGVTSSSEIQTDDVDCYNKFTKAKEWNRLEVKALAENDWIVDWSTMTLVDAQKSPAKAPPSVPTPKQASTPVKTPKAAVKINLAEFGEKDRLTHDQLIQVLRDAGFNGKALEVAYAVARAESGHRPKAFNGNAKSGDKSYGIFQINMIGKLGAARRQKFGLSSNEDLFQPEINARIAYEMSGGGKNWKPWGAYRNGSYSQYLTSL